MGVQSNFYEPANSLIEAFGGCSNLARLMGLSRATVSVWRSAHETTNWVDKRGRSDLPFRGRIPLKHWYAIKKLALRHHIDVECVPIDLTYVIRLQKSNRRV